MDDMDMDDAKFRVAVGGAGGGTGRFAAQG